MERPKITIITGISLDGKISLDKNTSSKIFDQSITPGAFIPLVELKEKNDAVMVGSNTIMTDNANLIGNEFYRVNNSIKRIVTDTTCKVPLDYRIFKIEPHKTIIATTQLAPKSRIEEVRKTGATVIVAGERQVNLKALFGDVLKLGIKSVLVEGGGKLNYSLMREKLVDELIVVVFPFAVGNVNAPSLFDGEGFEHSLLKFKLKETRIINDNIFLYYTP